MPQRIVDLTLLLTEGMRTWDVKPPFTMLPGVNASTFTLGFSTKLLVMEDHTGTHVDSTYHFYDGQHRGPRGKTIEELPLERFAGEGVLVDVSFKAPSDPIDRGLLVAAARDPGVDVRRGDVLLLHPRREVLRWRTSSRTRRSGRRPTRRIRTPAIPKQM